MKEYKEPWHVLPGKMIELGLYFSRQDTDFDHQIGYLLLDIGVEAALKAFLLQASEVNIEKKGFPEILKLVKEELVQRDAEEIDFEKIRYFHDVRNKLYHQGDGVVATQANMENYGNLARNVLRVLMGIEVGDIGEEEISKRRAAKSVRIRMNIRSLLANASILTEELYPQLATRKLAAQIEAIDHNLPILGNEVPPYATDPYQEERFEKFLALVGGQISEEDLDYELVDSFIQLPKVLPVWIAFRELEDDPDMSLNRFISIYKGYEFGEKWGPAKEWEAYEDVHIWTKAKAEAVYKWVHDRIPNIETEFPDNPFA